MKRASFPTKNFSRKSARNLPMSRARHILTIFFGTVQMTRGQRARVISHQKLVPQIRASFTHHARASSTRRYACFTRGPIFFKRSLFAETPRYPCFWCQNLKMAKFHDICTIDHVSNLLWTNVAIFNSN